LIYLADILSLSRDASAAVVVGSLAESKHPTLVRAAIGALRKIRKRESIPPLLALLESLEKKDRAGLLYQETRDALYDLTGENFESLADWKNWWEPRKESYTPDSAEVGQTRVVRRAREDAPEFVGRQIFASNTIFVIDTSGTMQYVMKNDIPGIARGDGSDSAKIVKEATEELTPENERLARYWTRLEMARRALLRALHGFSPRAVVNVEEFNRVVRLLEKKPARFTGNMKKSLIARVERLSVSLAPGTDTLEALETAMASDKGLAAIYFLSDGLPSADGQKNDDPMPILEKMEVLNRFRKVKIHTFGYDPEWTDAGGQKFADPELTRANEFLQKLAERSGGTFTLLEVTDEEPPESFK
jgi:hypothetical protein